MRSWLPALCAVLAVSEAGAELYAERLSPDNLAQRRVGGSDAIGGLDDWAFGNGTLCAVVSDPSHENATSVVGGALVDVAHCGRADDQFVLATQMLNLERGAAPAVDRVRAEVADGEARIVVDGRRDGLRFETVYAAAPEQPTALRIHTSVERFEAGRPFVALGETLLHPSASLGPFALETRRRGVSTGFAHRDPSRPAAGRGPAPDVQVLVGDDGIEPGIAYGWQLVSARLERAGGETVELPHFTSTGPSHSMFGVFANPVEEPSPEALAGVDLAVGDRFVFERRLWVGDRADVASVTDQLFAEAPLVTGRLSDPAARLHVFGLDKQGPVTELRPDADGAFRVRLPEGTYELQARAPGGRSARRRIVVPAAGADLAPLSVGASARVRLPGGGPMRLVFVGIGRTPDPELRGDLLDRRVGRSRFDASARSNDVSLAGLPGDPSAVVLPPGRYRVYATRGPEYTLTHSELELSAGQEQTLEIPAPARVLGTPGWISADFHVHSALSFDSGLAEELRVASFLAQGTEVLVATEHDRVADYAPLIRRLGVDELMASVVGVELTGTVRTPQAPRTIGHSNVFPLPYRPEQSRGGAPRSEGVRLSGAIAGVRALGGERVFQLNHPRRASGEQDDEAFLSHLGNGAGYDPTQPLGEGPNASLIEVDPDSGLRDLDFDAVELMNGESMDYYRAVRADWFSFLLQGERITGTANSDSHRLRSLVGMPRTYVRVADDRVPALDEGELIGAVLAGRAIGTTGPWLEVRLGEAGVGGSFRGRRGTLAVEVRAAPWVPVSTARVYVNGALVAERPAGPDVRLEVPLTFATDAFVTVEAEGVADEDYRAVAPGFTPFAFTNPIWVDADGDGTWSPPGLPAELPATLRAAPPAAPEG